MILLLPMNGDDIEESKLTDIFSASFWATIEIVEGRLIDTSFYTSYGEIINQAEGIVVCNDYEPVMEFFEAGLVVLVAHTQRYIDDIVEAYLFRELHDLAL
jgi:hypothetical protein